MSPSRNRVLFLYDQGAAGPQEIVSSVSGFAEPVFGLADTGPARAAMPVLRALGAEHHQLPVRAAPALLGLLSAPVQGVVTFSENMVRATAELAEALGVPGHRPPAARLLTDKVAQRRALCAAGVDDVVAYPVRCAAELDRALQHTGVPAIMKPSRGQGSRATHVITHLGAARSIFTGASRELLATSDAGGPLLVEEFLRSDGAHGRHFGGYVSAEVAIVAGRVAVLAVNGKFPLAYPFRESGSFTPSQLPQAEETAVRRLAADAVTALGMGDGISHIEIQLTPSGPRILECNGRLGGFVHRLMALATGVNLIELATRIALAEPVEPATLPKVSGVTFQWKNTPPLGARTLLEVQGAPRLRVQASVRSYSTLIPPRSPLSRHGHSQPLDSLYAQVTDPAGMLPLLDSLLAMLTFCFEMQDGTRCWLRADELRDLNVRPHSAGSRTAGVQPEPGRPRLPGSARQQ